MGCKLVSDNESPICSVCTEGLQEVQDCCWICCRRLLDEAEHIYCQSCKVKCSVIAQTKAIFKSNYLINKIVANSIEGKSLREIGYITEVIKNTLSLHKLQKVFLLDKKHKVFLNNIGLAKIELINNNSDCYIKQCNELDIFIPAIKSFFHIEKSIEKILSGRDSVVNLYIIVVNA